MKTTVAKELRELITDVGQAFEKFPWENRAAYVQWLAQTYFYVRHTTCFLSLCASRWGIENREQQYKAIKHLKEETSHDLLLLNDLKSLDSKIEDHSEWPETQSFYQTQYYWIEHKTPAAHLGYAYLLEGMASEKAGDVYRKVIETHGKKSGEFLRIHAEVDKDHAEDAFENLSKFNDQELEYLIQCSRQSAFLYKIILEKANRS